MKSFHSLNLYCGILSLVGQMSQDILSQAMRDSGINPVPMDDISEDEARLVTDETAGDTKTPGKVNRKRSINRSEEGSSSPEMEGKKGKVEELTVYMKGKSKVITQVNQTLLIKSINDQFQPMAKIERSGQCLRITCNTMGQKKKLLSGTLMVADVEVTCSEPRQVIKRTEKGYFFKVLATGVPGDISAEEIVEAGKASSGWRLKNKVNGDIVPTSCVVLIYKAQTDIPKYVLFEWLKFNIRPYVPAPIRCFVCSGFGHKSTTCKKSAVCPKCSGAHKMSECNSDILKCKNCGGSHHAASKDCPKYKMVRSALEITCSKAISYRDALVQVKTVAKETESPKTNT